MPHNEDRPSVDPFSPLPVRPLSPGIGLGQLRPTSSRHKSGPNPVANPFQTYAPPPQSLSQARSAPRSRRERWFKHLVNFFVAGVADVVFVFIGIMSAAVLGTVIWHLAAEHQPLSTLAWGSLPISQILRKFGWAEKMGALAFAYGIYWLILQLILGSTIGNFIFTKNKDASGSQH